MALRGCESFKQEDLFGHPPLLGLSEPAVFRILRAALAAPLAGAALLRLAPAKVGDMLGGLAPRHA